MSNFSESHNRVKLIMNYDVSKTATENSVNEQVIVTPSWSIFKFNEWMKTWDTHDWFTLVQLVLMFLGFFSGGMTSIVSLALGTVAGVAEAAVFLVRDKDPYMATVMLILSILGVDDLMRINRRRSRRKRRRTMSRRIGMNDLAGLLLLLHGRGLGRRGR